MKKKKQEEKEDEIKWSNQMKNVNIKIHSFNFWSFHFVKLNEMKWCNEMNEENKKVDKMTKEKSVVPMKMKFAFQICFTFT